MIDLLKKTLFLCGFAALVAGCSDPLVGTWEGIEDRDVDLDIESAGDGYRGEGHIYLCSDTECFLCPFDFDAEEAGDDRWDISGRFTGSCSEAGEFEDVTCSLAGDGDELDCDLPGGGSLTYEKRQ